MSRHLLAPMLGISEAFTETSLNDPVSKVDITKYQQWPDLQWAGPDPAIAMHRRAERQGWQRGMAGWQGGLARDF